MYIVLPNKYDLVYTTICQFQINWQPAVDPCGQLILNLSANLAHRCGPEGPAAGAKRPHVAEGREGERSETAVPEAND